MPKYISTADLATAQGVTVQAINRWKKKAEQKAERMFGKSSELDARVIVFSELEVKLILECGPKSKPSMSSARPIEAEIVDTGEIKSIVPLNSSVVRPAMMAHFNRNAVNQDLSELENQRDLHAHQGNNSLVSFARTSMFQAAARIQTAVATMEANAMAELGAVANDVVAGD